MKKVQGAVVPPPDPPIEILLWIPFMVWMGASILTAPLEMLLRPKFGTRYFSPVVIAASWIVLQLFGIAGIFIQMWARSLAPIGMPTLITAFHIGVIVHLIRLYPLFKDMDKERLSYSDGPGWWFFGALPQADVWLRVRTVYEPVATVGAVFVLYQIGIMSGTAAAFLTLSAIALSIKCGFMNWQTFLVERGQRDQQVLAEMFGQVNQSQRREMDEPVRVIGRAMRVMILALALAMTGEGMTVAVRTGDVIEGRRIIVLGKSGVSSTISGSRLAVVGHEENAAWEAMPLQLMEDGTPVFQAQTANHEIGIFTPSRVVAISGMKIPGGVIDRVLMLRASQGVVWMATFTKDHCRTCTYMGVFKDNRLLAEWPGRVALDLAIDGAGTVYYTLNSAVVYREGVEWLRRDMVVDGCHITAFGQGLTVSPQGLVAVPVRCLPYKSGMAFINGRVVPLNGALVGVSESGELITRGIVPVGSRSGARARYLVGDRQLQAGDWRIRGAFMGLGNYAILSGGQELGADTPFGRITRQSLAGLGGRGNYFINVMPAVNRSGQVAFLGSGLSGMFIAVVR